MHVKIINKIHALLKIKSYLLAFTSDDLLSYELALP